MAAPAGADRGIPRSARVAAQADGKIVVDRVPT